MIGCRRSLSAWAASSFLSLSACSLLESKSSVPEKQASCVEDAETAKKASFDAEPELAARLTATLVGTAVLAQTADNVDRELATTCENLARELGGEVKSPDAEAGQRAKPSCELAIERIKAAREKAGATLIVEQRPAICHARTNDFETCARECDPNLSSSVKVGCLPEATSGRCGSKCTGQCIQTATDDCAGVCRGTCQGKCMEGFFGTCGGRCIGDCDGKTTNGKCEGTCDGKCTSESSGSCEAKCEGKCAGACLTETKGKQCDGTCAGSCSEAFSDLRCSEVVAPEEMAPECRARCDAELASRMTCTAGHADVTVFSAADRERAERLRSALTRTFTAVLNLEQGSVAQLRRAAEGLGSGLSSVEEAASETPAVQKQAASCFDAAKSKQARAGATLEAFVEVSAALVQATKP